MKKLLLLSFLFLCSGWWSEAFGQITFRGCENAGLASSYTLNADGSITDGSGVSRNVYKSNPANGAFGELIIIKWSTADSRWEIYLNAVDGDDGPNNELLYSSDIATAPNPPNLAIGNWTKRDLFNCDPLDATHGELSGSVEDTPPAASPVITANPPNRYLCTGSNTTFSITASDATSYQWQVDTGSGFSDIANGAPYSGATTATLSVTGATAAFNGYVYRCVASNGSGWATSGTATLTVSAIVLDSGSQTDVSCNGGANGTATVSPTGGVAPYYYSWSPAGGTGSTATGLSAGTYTVTVTDDIGCTSQRSFTISQPSALQAVITSYTNVSTNGGSDGSATVSVSGGTGTYSYIWSPGGATTATANGLSAGNYSVLVTDNNGCTATTSVTIADGAVPAPTITSTPITSVPYNTAYSYGIVASTEGDLETTLSAPTLPDWLTFSTDGQNGATLFGDFPEGTQLSGVAGDDSGNIYAIRQNGTEIFKTAPDGTTTSWKSGLANGNVYALHIANGYIYIPRHADAVNSLTRVPLNDPSATEEVVVSVSGGVLSLTDKDGYLYAAAYSSIQILKINEVTKASEVLLNSTDSLPGGGPFGMVMDDDDNLYIATYSNRSILKYDGTSLTTVLSGLPAAVTSVKQDATGNFYLSMAGGGVRKYDASWSAFETVSQSANDNIWSLSFTASGALVYSIHTTNSIYRLQTGAILSGTPDKSQLGDHPVVIRAQNASGYTEQAFTITVTDETAPVTAAFAPANNATEVSLEPTLTLTFDEKIILGNSGVVSLYDGTTVLFSLDLSDTDDRSKITVASDGLSFSFDVDATLPVNTLVAVEISAGFVEDEHDNTFAGFTAASGT
ncbi:Ig-like domain-containing protein [Sinomicrobium oceani]|uniref:Ig-like domain-containing protein n=1 Tax=Sinomicrobium oceani TaxID=1150368 RepID=UPI00227A6922|nr:Ig-like domain-containing protein [Sinomicrobium oceani]